MTGTNWDADVLLIQKKVDHSVRSHSNHLQLDTADSVFQLPVDSARSVPTNTRVNKYHDVPVRSFWSDQSALDFSILEEKTRLLRWLVLTP
jgi:hypothetical protein